ncbi:aspartate/glutamate racemase family protein [Parasalinivibrio latis]|uniref:aspartate/glutamate racemase family protein n=1 Tax=Parasalinivibrio latis TaxID=2952610 RepID=UPI0030E509D1
MKTIGIIGGMSWESTATYYQILNREVRHRLGGFHSAPIILHSLDFAEIEACQSRGDWESAGVALADSAKRLEIAGADIILLATNTMHKVASYITDASSVPFLHIADATADKLKAAGITKVGLIATRFTMEQDFYKTRLTEVHGINVVVPDKQGRDTIHRIIYEELVQGILKDESRTSALAVLDQLREEGVEAVLLGCTELELLIKPEHTTVPLFDTTAIHATKAVELALE